MKVLVMYEKPEEEAEAQNMTRVLQLLGPSLATAEMTSEGITMRSGVRSKARISVSCAPATTPKPSAMPGRVMDGRGGAFTVEGTADGRAGVAVSGTGGAGGAGGGSGGGFVSGGPVVAYGGGGGPYGYGLGSMAFGQPMRLAGIIPGGQVPVSRPPLSPEESAAVDAIIEQMKAGAAMNPLTAQELWEAVGKLDQRDTAPPVKKPKMKPPSDVRELIFDEHIEQEEDS